MSEFSKQDREALQRLDEHRRRTSEGWLNRVLATPAQAVFLTMVVFLIFIALMVLVATNNDELILEFLRSVAP